MKVQPTDPELMLTQCDREPIHIPGAIQPHGVLLALDHALRIRGAAGAIAERLELRDWAGLPISEVVGDDIAARLARFSESGVDVEWIAQSEAASGERFDLSAHRSGDRIIVEFEPGSNAPMPAIERLGELERAANTFERALDLKGLCERACVEFRQLTGFDRVMVYRFLSDEAGTVVAEDRAPGLSSFLNHHFPGSDIPRQARALYVRNLIRVIPNVDYEPAPFEPAAEAADLDMSDCALRSVSPIHLDYLRNMGVAASASISIVVDDALWGLVACHGTAPRHIPYEIRSACRTLAGVLSRQIKAREDADIYRERIRLRGAEDDLFVRIGRKALEEDLVAHAGELRRILNADGVAIVHGRDCALSGVCPPAEAALGLARWVTSVSPSETLSTHELGRRHPEAAVHAALASGLMAITISAGKPIVILWFRAEAVEVVKWAGNPHEAVRLQDGETLTPRSSFEAWREEVRGRSRRWSLAEIESAGRLRRTLFELRQTRRLRDINARLSETVADKDLLLGQNELLLREVNHRVQNSLTLVSSFLALQRRGSDDPALRTALDEAERRVMAVSLVHRRLYRGDQIETVDLDRYLGEMCDEVVQSMGGEWGGNLKLDAAPVIIPTDKAVTIGLIVTELVINVNKYAYAGKAGPIEISLRSDGAELRLVVGDQGQGSSTPKGGFGTRMIDSLVRQLRGHIDYSDNRPGLRATVTAPVV